MKVNFIDFCNENEFLSQEFSVFFIDKKDSDNFYGILSDAIKYHMDLIDSTLKIIFYTILENDKNYKLFYFSILNKNGE